MNEYYVYLMHTKQSNDYKIGISNSPSSRLSALKTANPRIELLQFFECRSMKHAKKIERAMLTRYKAFQIWGEWFELNDEQLDGFKEILKTYAQSENRLLKSEKSKRVYHPRPSDKPKPKVEFRVITDPSFARRACEKGKAEIKVRVSDQNRNSISNYEGYTIFE